MNAEARIPVRAWLPTVLILAASIAAAIIVSRLPDHYEEHHMWPAVAFVSAVIFGMASLAKLFWVIAPSGRRGQIIFALSISLLALSSLAWRNVVGIVIGVIGACYGYSLMTLKKRV